MLSRVKSPWPFRVAIYSDFDGTISQQDSLKLLLNQFGSETWFEIEKKLSSGRMSERDALAQCFQNFQLTVSEARDWVLQNVSLDPSFSAFEYWSRVHRFDLKILSGGFEEFIHPLLKRERLGHLKVLANRAAQEGASWKVTPCATERLCSECNHCKSYSLYDRAQKAPKTLIVYIGDGHTDSCPVQLAHIVFAKGALKKYCAQQGIEAFEYDDFFDIRERLDAQLRYLSRQYDLLQLLRRKIQSHREAMQFSSPMIQRWRRRQEALLRLQRKSTWEICSQELNYPTQQFLAATQAA